MHVLITGGTGGIGSAMVRLFAKKGFKVSFTYYKSQSQAQALAHECSALAICADGKEEESVKAACLAATEQNGKIDALINCAGISSFQLFQDVSTALWEETMQTNLRSAFFYIREVLPSMIAQKAGADLISFHVESNSDISETIKKITSANKKAALVVKPNTPINTGLWK